MICRDVNAALNHPLPVLLCVGCSTNWCNGPNDVKCCAYAPGKKGGGKDGKDVGDGKNLLTTVPRSSPFWPRVGRTSGRTAGPV